MGVDGIGRGGGRPLTGVGGPAPGAAPGVDGPSGPSAAQGVASPAAASVAETSPLAQLQRGEITLDQYLDVRVTDAVSPYVGKVPDAQLEFIKGSLRDALANDPVVVELVRRTTGAVPSATD